MRNSELKGSGYPIAESDCAYLVGTAFLETVSKTQRAALRLLGCSILCAQA